MKQEFIRYTCDHCNKVEDTVELPSGWIAIRIKGGHLIDTLQFCSAKCTAEHIMNYEMEYNGHE